MQYTAQVKVSVEGEPNLYDLQTYLEGAVMLDLDTEIDSPDGFDVDGVCVGINWETLKPEK